MNKNTRATTPPTRRLLPALLLATCSALTLGACNTVEGAGEDIEDAGEAIQDSAED